MSEDASSPTWAPDAAAELETPPPLAVWPPPGLERVQGDLWGVIDRLAVGGAVFTLPLLAALALPQDPWRPGIYGDAWWVVLVTSLVGLWFLLAGHVQLFRALRRWSAAVGRGYRARTVGLVMADRQGDTGFVLQGGRAYSLIDERTRAAMLSGRLVRVGLLTGAGLWMSLGFILGVLLSARGILDEQGLAFWTLLPPTLGVAGSWVLRLWENGIVLNARRAWHAKPWSEDLARDEIRGWHEAISARPGAVGVPEASADAGGRGLRWAAAGTLVAAVAILLFAVPLVTTSGVGPVLTAVSVPRFSATAERAARAEALVPLRLPVDPSITVEQAGEALLAIVGPGQNAPPLRSLPGSYDLFPDNSIEENPTGIPAYRWSQDLVPLLSAGLDGATVSYLVGLGSYPIHEELTTLAHAGALDEVSALYELPLPETMSSWELPIPKYTGLRQLAYAQAGAAVGAAAAGRLGEAETRFRELISVGLLLGDNSSTLIGNLIGYVVASVGADGLAQLYDVTGRADEAEALRERLRAAERAAQLGRSGLGSAQISNMPDMVADTTAVRGIRVEYLATISTIGPCLNLNRAVFGPPDDYEAWLERARASFARTEGEQQVFSLAQRGLGSPGDIGGLQPVARLYGQVMGSGIGSCAEMAAALIR